MASFIVTLVLLVQLIALPYRQALPSAEFSVAGPAAVSAELKAAFGAAASLCVQADDKAGPSRGAPAGSRCDHCPLCRFSSQASALALPDAPVLPGRRKADGRTVGVASEVRVSDRRLSLAHRARAPPFAV